jgi:hypothetical protein
MIRINCLRRGLAYGLHGLIEIPQEAQMKSEQSSCTRQLIEAEACHMGVVGGGAIARDHDFHVLFGEDRVAKIEIR